MRQLLVAAIRQTHEYIAAQVGRAVSVSLTLRNWVIGCYIREYEQNGQIGRNMGPKFSNIWEESYRNRSTGVITPDTYAFAVGCIQLTPKFEWPGKEKSAIS